MSRMPELATSWLLEFKGSPTGPGPEGCDENGPAAALLVDRVSNQIYSLLAPCRRPIFIATKYMLFRGQDTSISAR